MDEPGYHARRRADREARDAIIHPHRYEDVQPLAEVDDEEVSARIEVPNSVHDQSGFNVLNYRPPPAVPDENIPGAMQDGSFAQQGNYGGPTPAAGTEEAQKHHHRMEPHLQLQCGPMLRYDTCKDGIYHAFAMIVTADTGSDYSATPFMAYRYTPRSGGASGLEQQFSQSVSLQDGQQGGSSSGGEVVETVEARKIFIYHSLSGGNSFWRFKIEVKQGELEMPVHYRVNNGREITFYVPGREQNFRFVGHSCNGFSAGVDTEAFNGPDPLWNDLLKKHSQQPIHVLVGGGDQIYCDSLAQEPEMLEWMNEKNEERKQNATLSPEIRFAVDRFFFNHYCKWFRTGAFGRAISCIPMANMLDDHDLIDGFGSYDDVTQASPVFSHIGSRGIFFYQLFQLFIVDEFDGTLPHIPHSNLSIITGGPGPWVPFDNHSFLIWLGPDIRMLLLDCRTERKKTQCVSPVTYERVFAAIRALPSRVKHFILLLGVPIAYPRMVFAEAILSSKLNPMVLLGKSGLAGLAGMVNKFNHDAELLDDLNDHWTAKTHKVERNWLINELVKVAISNRLRISILSGDVHLAAVGHFFDKHYVAPEKDPRYIVNIISSAIVNTPPPAALVGLQGQLNKKTHKTLHSDGIDETMIAVFEHDTDGSKLKNPYFMGRRNYCLNTVLPGTNELEYDIRVEIAQGIGETKGYPVRIPAPGW